MESNWQSRTVSQLEASRILLVQDGNHGEYRPRREELVADGTPHIRAADIGDDGAIDFSGAQRINEVARARIKKGVGARGDVLLTHKGTVGRLARVPADAPHFVCSPQTTFWRSLDDSQLDQAFLFSYMRSPAFAAQLRMRMHESDMAPYVSLTAQRSLTVVLPPIAEQRRIASVLRALDDKIGSNRRLTSLLEEAAVTVFRARFVAFVGEGNLVETPLGRAPVGWKVASIGDMLKIVGGSTPSTKERRYWDGGTHCWATPKDLAGARTPILLDTERRITDEGVNRISSRLLPKRTVLLSSRAPVGYTAMSFIDVAVNQGFIAIPPSASMPGEYLLLWLREHMEVIKAHAGGTTFAEISKRAFRPLLMLVPPAGALAEFQQLARPIFDLLAAKEKETLALADVRDSILPMLISRKIRVPDTNDAEDGIDSCAERLAGAKA
jgi:type I restriction enzyme, S subunit